MRFAVLLLASFLAAPVLSAQHTVPSGGQWLIERGDHPSTVQLTVRYGEGRHSNDWSRDVPIGELVGLSATDMSGSGATVHFKIVRSAGTLTCEGWFDDGKGSGHFTYQPSPEFVAELAKRGINAPPPTAWEQFQMTMSGVGVDLVDELARQKYDRPTAGDLARMGTHGVDLEYVRDIGARGYHLRDPESLVRMRDHGCGPGVHRVTGQRRLQEPQRRRARAPAGSRCRWRLHRRHEGSGLRAVERRGAGGVA